ncbi:MAG: hypothetical protein A2Y40_06110 [Candidatus Margulisbacteria bacterium GWF2_35_9]|nr:MAG: hypothetical protein A2Y40_06110 [Candidatus Margulisbacteria bacterium GWF2_35_9]
MIKITIDGQLAIFDEPITIVHAAKKLGISIPTLCHDDSLHPYGSCLLCTVELTLGKQRKMVPSCVTQITDGMIIETTNEKVDSTRKMALELLLSDHFGDCIAPCKLEGCPAHIDIEGFLKLESEGKYKEAATLIREMAPFPNILGRVCPAPCEQVCRRNRVDESVMIRAQKRFISEKEIKSGGPFLPSIPKKNNKQSVAIIGAGPAGMSAAYYLALNSFQVTIFEKNPKSGGMLRYGIPYYRLPENILEIECDAMMAQLNIDVRYNTEIGKDILLETIINDYDAVLLAVGALNPYTLGIPGENEAGIIQALDFLHDIADKKTPDLGKKVVVVGGGHTAMDAARSAVRFGADTDLVYRRTENEMPAKDEIHEAIEEGVQMNFLTTPVAVKRLDNQLHLTCIKMALSEADASGRKRPVPIEGSEYTIVADRLITAIGQKPDFSFVPEVFTDAKGWLKSNTTNYQLQSNDKVFAVGDCVTGPDLVVTAVAQGREVASSIRQFLSGEAVIGETKLFSSSCGKLSTLPEEMFAEFPKVKKGTIPSISLDKRQTSFAQIEGSLTETEMKYEAGRCLACGCDAVSDCKLKEYSEEYSANATQFIGDKRTYEKDYSHSTIAMETDKCINCSSCIRACDELKQFYVFGYEGRGFDSRIKPELNKKLSESACDGCEKCVAVCPTAGVHVKKF